MRWLFLGALALCLAGCSAIIDSDQYVGGGGGTDAGTDSSVPDPGDAGGPTDAGEDPCMGVTCPPTEMCDPVTGDCVPRCMPACADDEVCVMGTCMDCDGDDDGHYVDGVRCAPLRGTAPPDCDDADDAVYPGAPIVCGDGKINSCPSRVLEAIHEVIAPMELARVAPFEVEFDGSIADEHPWVSVVSRDPSGGVLAFMGTSGPLLGTYDLPTRASAVQPLTDLVSLPDTTGVRAVAAGFADGRLRVATHQVGTGGSSAVMYAWEPGSALADDVSDAYSIVEPPLAIGFASNGTTTGGAMIFRGVEGSTNTIHRMSSALTTSQPNSAIVGAGGFLDATGSLVLASASESGDIIVADDFDARRMPVATDGGAGPFAPIGTPGGVFVTAGAAGPDYLAVIPTREGLVPLVIDCSGGFPFDLAECITTFMEPFGSAGLSRMDAAMARADDLGFAAATVPDPVGTGETHLVAHVVAADGAPVDGPTGMPLAFPVMTSENFGFSPEFLDVAADDFFVSGEGVTMTFAAAVNDGSSVQLWLAGLQQCPSR